MSFRTIFGTSRGRRRWSRRLGWAAAPVAGLGACPVAGVGSSGTPGSDEPSRAGLALALGEGVADATDRHYEGRHGRIVLDLVAEMADVDVDRLLVLVEGLVVAEELE